ncbi:MAG: Smr/MutS family protein [Acidobacteria bacterium]|nr:Smr/MutS family protein [Acidobacteriota bacterium]
METDSSTVDSAEEPIEIEITDTLDLHAFHPRDVRAVTIAYLDEARRKRFRLVRIIHGKGIGVQREIVRNVLTETEFVKGFKSGDEFSGGAGATVAELSGISD